MSLIFLLTILIVFHLYDFLSKLTLLSISALCTIWYNSYNNNRTYKKEVYNDPTFSCNNNNEDSIKSTKHSPECSTNEPKLKLEDVPGPFNLPFYGSSWLYTWIGPYTHKKYHEASNDKFHRYGPVVREKVLFTNIIHLFDKDDIYNVLNYK